MLRTVCDQILHLIFPGWMQSMSLNDGARALTETLASLQVSDEKRSQTTACNLASSEFTSVTQTPIHLDDRRDRTAPAVTWSVQQRKEKVNWDICISLSVMSIYTTKVIWNALDGAAVCPRPINSIPPASSIITALKWCLWHYIIYCIHFMRGGGSRNISITVLNCLLSRLYLT